MKIFKYNSETTYDINDILQFESYCVQCTLRQDPLSCVGCAFDIDYRGDNRCGTCFPFERGDETHVLFKAVKADITSYDV